MGLARLEVRRVRHDFVTSLLRCEHKCCDQFGGPNRIREHEALVHRCDSSCDLSDCVAGPSRSSEVSDHAMRDEVDDHERPYRDPEHRLQGAKRQRAAIRRSLLRELDYRRIKTPR